MSNQLFIEKLNSTIGQLVLEFHRANDLLLEDEQEDNRSIAIVTTMVEALVSDELDQTPTAKLEGSKLMRLVSKAYDNYDSWCYCDCELSSDKSDACKSGKGHNLLVNEAFDTLGIQPEVIEEDEEEEEDE